MSEKDLAIKELWNELWNYVKIVAQTAGPKEYEVALSNSVLEKWQHLILDVKNKE